MSMTPRQKQGIMAMVADENGNFYYNDQLDGLWGPKSQEAAERFLRDFTGEETAPAPEPTGDFWDDIEFFKREEFKCKCGGQYCDGYPAEMQEKVVRIADAARKHFGRPAHVVSGLRCETWNTIQGGVWNSQHRYGEAIDLRVDGVTADDLLAFVDTQPIRYAYAINGTNVHFDITKGKR